jgi:hypothetical protein
MPLEDSDDRACLSALAAQLGHEAPFSATELATIKTLTVTHALNLAPLEGCLGLKHLRIVASELRNLLSLENMQELKHLEIHCSKLESLLGGAFCQKLERVDLLYSTVQDAFDLMGIGSLKRGSVIGIPWLQTSQEFLRSELENFNKLLEVSSVDDWKTARVLWERTGACWGAMPNGPSFLVFPGLPKFTDNVFDALKLHSSTVDHEMQVQAEHFSLEKLFEEYKSQIIVPNLSELAQMHTLGSGSDALEWIANSPLSDDGKIRLEGFVKRFPNIVYYCTNERMVKNMTFAELELPEHYRQILETLTGWMPLHRSVQMRFDQFEGWSPHTDRVTTISYDAPGLRGHGDDVKHAMLEAGFANISWDIPNGQEHLAIRLREDDPQIYGYNIEDISDAISEGRDVNTSMYVVFPSYAAMLGRIVSLHPSERDPIPAGVV